MPTIEQLKKTDGKFVRVADLLYVRNGRLYGMKTIHGKLIRKVAPVQGLDALDLKGRVTAAAKRWVLQWSSMLESEEYFAEVEEKKEVVPTLIELIREYEIIAEAEYALNHSPAPATVAMCVGALKRLAKRAGLPLSSRTDALTAEVLQRLADELLRDGLKPVTVYAQFNQARSVFAQWALERYRLKGWTVVQPPWPRRRGRALLSDRYQRPPEALRNATLEWYRALEAQMPMVWVAATLMLQCGMRNGDTARLRWSDFEVEADRVVIGYTPNKTSASSGRRVHCAISLALYERLRAAGGKGDFVLEGARECYILINSSMRSIGWSGGKGAYELRKMCIDRIYREFGAEAAVQVSGDDIRTVCRYYADPSRATRVCVDLE